jgi:hypothetical protein
VGHPQKQEKADPSFDFFERRKQDAFAWGRPRDDSDLAHGVEDGTAIDTFALESHSWSVFDGQDSG